MGFCLVVGGGGFIGSHLVRALLATGRDVLVAGRSSSPRWPVAGAAYKCIHPANHDGIAALLSGCDEIIDLAYATVPKTSFDDPLLDVVANLPFTVSLLSAASKARIKRLVLVSSGGTVYGNPAALPIDESHLTNPLSPYGITKLATEKYGQMYHRLNGLPIVIVRPGNPYGPGQLGSLGQGFIATVLFNALQRKEVSIFGERGTVRDYIYISDLADGILASLAHGQLGEIYNIGTGVGMDNRSVLDKVQELVEPDGFGLTISIKPARSFDVAANVLDATRLTQISGWQPKTNFDLGLAETWNWVRSYAG